MLRRFQHDQKLEKMATTVQNPNQVKSYCEKGKRRRGGAYTHLRKTGSAIKRRFEFLIRPSEQTVITINIEHKPRKNIQARIRFKFSG
jgi:hypothetical protein